MRPHYVPVPIAPPHGRGIRSTCDGGERSHCLYRYFDRVLAEDASSANPSVDLIVLFVPGHAGDHAQARSIGSETLFAAARRKHRIHFYTVSVGESLMAFDGNVLAEQATWIGRVLDALDDRYASSHFPRRSTAPAIFIVAHSMGGIAVLDALRARMLALRAPPRTLAVDAVVMLGVPLLRPPIACSSSLDALYASTHDFWARHARSPATPAVASLWGGCRDWHVPAELSRLNATIFGEAMALSAPTQSLPNVASTTDHLSLLWCNQLVRVVAHAIVNAAALRVSSTAVGQGAEEAVAAAPPLSQRVASLRASLLDTLQARDAAATADTHPNGALLLDAIPLAWQHVVRALRHQPAQMLLDSAWVCTALQGLAPPSAVASSSPAPSHSRTPLASLMALAAAGTLGALAAGHSSAAGDGAHTQRVALARVAVATSLSYLLMLVTSLSWSRATTRRPRRSTAVLLAAIPVGATLHPALGFLLMTLARPHRVAPLALLASAALLPGAAAWWRRGPREPAALYSADAREGLLCLLALVVASLGAAAASARRWLVGAIGARRGAQLRRLHALGGAATMRMQWIAVAVLGAWPITVAPLLPPLTITTHDGDGGHLAGRACSAAAVVRTCSAAGALLALLDAILESLKRDEG